MYLVIFDFSLFGTLALTTIMAFGVRCHANVNHLIGVFLRNMRLLTMLWAKVPLFVACTFPILAIRHMQTETTFYITVQILQLETFPNADLVSSALLVWTRIESYTLRLDTDTGDGLPA